MSEAVFEKNGLVIYEDRRNDEGEWVKERQPPDEPLTKLRCSCEIAEGVTLSDIFEAVDAIPELKDFVAQYAWCGHIDDFHTDARKDRPEDADSEKLSHLVICWQTQNLRHKGLNDFSIYTDFYGVGAAEGDANKYGVSYSPMWELAGLPVKLDNTVTLYSSVRKPGSPEIIYQGNKGFTLLEVLDAIYDDISFMGGPEENAEFLDHIRDTVEGIKNGRIETFPMDLPPPDKYHDPQNN